MILKEKLGLIYKNILSAQKKGGFDHHVKVVAVTKTRPFSFIEESYRAGVYAIGENRIQEAEKKLKQPEITPGLIHRFIGHLQSNKVNKCLNIFDTIDSVNSHKLARKISNRASELGRKVPVLLQINTSGESQKSGFNPEQVDEMLACISEKNILVEGLMTIGPNTKNQGEIRKSFAGLHMLLESLNAQTGEKNLRELSMGMSGDYELAVEEGSTMVRLGTVLFGGRK